MPRDPAIRDLARSATEPLAPGRYRNASFAPPLSFAVGEGWFAVQSVPGFFDVEVGPGTPDVIAVQFARPVGAATSGETVEGIRLRPWIRASTAVPAILGGRAAVTLLVDAEDADLSANRFVPVFDVALGPISLASGRRLWLALIDTSDGVLAVLVGGSVRGWQAAEDAAAPVLASIRFEA